MKKIFVLLCTKWLKHIKLPAIAYDIYGAKKCFGGSIKSRNYLFFIQRGEKIAVDVLWRSAPIDFFLCVCGLYWGESISEYFWTGHIWESTMFSLRRPCICVFWEQGCRHTSQAVMAESFFVWSYCFQLLPPTHNPPNLCQHPAHPVEPGSNLISSKRSCLRSFQLELIIFSPTACYLSLLPKHSSVLLIIQS